MGKLSKGLGIIFNITSFVFVLLSAFPQLRSTPDDPGGISPAFAFWAYSVIFALIATVLYTVGAFRALKLGGGIGKLTFTIIILILCISIGGKLDTLSIYVWNIIFAINLILQIRWLIKS